MSAISVGRIVIKVMGRESGLKAVVTDIIDQNFVEITGPSELTSVKRRRVNINHIEPSEFKIELNRDDNSDKTVLGLIEKDKSIKDFMKAKVN